MIRFRFTVPLFAIALLIGAFGLPFGSPAAGVAPTAHAQTTSDGSNFQLPADYQSTIDSVQTNVNQDAQQAVTEAKTANAASAAAPSTAAPTDQTAAKTSTPPAAPTAGSSDSYGELMQYIMGIFAWLLGVAALTLDNVMYYTVVGMGNYVSHLTAIGTAWRILRDIGNIILIFGFLAIGITTILDVNWYGGGTKMLPMLLVGAVFLNFSLFLSEAFIDGGNIFATEFYTQINNGNAAKPIDYSIANIHNEGISNAIMSQLGLASIYGAALSPTTANGTAATAGQSIFKAGNSWYIGFMGVLLFLVAAFVMFSLAFILIARFVALILLIVVAPIGFAGLAIPQLSGTAKKWWNYLFQQTITAPILLLLLYVALAVITDAQFLTGFGVAGTSSNASNTAAGVWTNWITGGTTGVTGFGGMMLSFLVAMGLLLFVTITAKSMSAFGGDLATKWGSKLTVGMTAATIGFAGRRTVGYGSQRLSQMVRRSRFAETGIGRTTAGLLDKGAKGTFDIRGTSGVKNLGGLTKGAGLSFGDASKASFRKQEEDAIKARTTYAASLKGRTTKTKEEEKTIAEAEAKRISAEGQHSQAKNEQSTAVQENANRKAEVTRLEEEKKKDYYWNTNPDNAKKLEAAQQAVVASDAALEAANTRLAQAEEHRATQTNEANKTRAVIETALEPKAAAKAAQQRYGQNLQNNAFMSSVIFGPGAKSAGENIVKNAGKLKEQVQEELLKKWLKKYAEEGGGGEAKPAPAATPTPK